MRYNHTSHTKENGIVYTPIEMANYVASELINIKDITSLEQIDILDPAVGDGELLVALITVIKRQNPVARIHSVGFDTDLTVCESTEKRLSDLFPDVKIDIHPEDFLSSIEEGNVGTYDFIIANPPYIRTQIMGSVRSQSISNKLALSGRIDIYYAFIIYTNQVLKDNGVAGFITSNKFLTIKSGASVREFIKNNYMLHRITDLGDTKLFDASVLPCIMFFSKGKTGSSKTVSFTSVYETSDDVDSEQINTIFEAIYKSGYYHTPDGKTYHFQQGNLRSIESGDVWTLVSDEINSWLKKVDQNTWMRFSDLGKIRVGIKTTADNVFIGDDWSGEKGNIELLRPLITHRNAGQILPNKTPDWKVLYTHISKNGKNQAVDIDEYPMAKKYLLQHYEQLASRQYISKAKRKWYEIWVPQNPDSWSDRKIVFRDISDKPQFWFDNSGAVVNGDCYWIDIKPEIFDETLYLALAIANSRFIEKYYDTKFNTKLYSGKRRYMSQYVEQFPIPPMSSNAAKKAIDIIKIIVSENNESLVSQYKKELDELVDEMFS